jgi:hypothetical protein
MLVHTLSMHTKKLAIILSVETVGFPARTGYKKKQIEPTGNSALKNCVSEASAVIL